MVNTQLFQSSRGTLLPQPQALNHERAPAYVLSARHQLAQLAATGCLNDTFYADAQKQLDGIASLASAVDPLFVAKTAVYARQGCIDVAALVAAAVLRKNPQTRVLPFEQSVVKLALNPRDSVMTNAKALASIGGGGTNCSAPLAQLNAERAKVDLVILVSDNESWVDANRRGATQTMREWEALKQRSPNARLVCIDIQPYATTQAAERKDIMNIGGFSDAVFETIGLFADGKTGRSGAEHWVAEIEKVDLAVQ